MKEQLIALLKEIKFKIIRIDSVSDFEIFKAKFFGPNGKFTKIAKKIKKHKGTKVKKEGVNEAVEMGKGVKKLMKIADEGYGKVGGTTVDSMSANLFKQLYDKANDDIKQKLNKKNEKQLVMIIGRMWKKFGKNVTIGSSV